MSRNELSTQLLFIPWQNVLDLLRCTQQLCKLGSCSVTLAVVEFACEDIAYIFAGFESYVSTH